jgi:hypothetical protein
MHTAAITWSTQDARHPSPPQRSIMIAALPHWKNAVQG